MDIKINMQYLIKMNATAHDILNTFLLTHNKLRSEPKNELLYQHAFHISLHHNPYAVLKSISDDGKTVWEDGVESEIEMENDMLDPNYIVQGDVTN